MTGRETARRCAIQIPLGHKDGVDLAEKRRVRDGSIGWGIIHRRNGDCHLHIFRQLIFRGVTAWVSRVGGVVIGIAVSALLLCLDPIGQDGIAGLVFAGRKGEQDRISSLLLDPVDVNFLVGKDCNSFTFLKILTVVLKILRRNKCQRAGKKIQPGEGDGTKVFILLSIGKTQIAERDGLCRILSRFQPQGRSRRPATTKLLRLFDQMLDFGLGFQTCDIIYIFFRRLRYGRLPFSRLSGLRSVVSDNLLKRVHELFDSPRGFLGRRAGAGILADEAFKGRHDPDRHRLNSVGVGVIGTGAVLGHHPVIEMRENILKGDLPVGEHQIEKCISFTCRPNPPKQCCEW